MQPLEMILRESAKRHKHLCPRQVLGARMGILAGEILKLDLPRADKKLLVIAETDGCTVDGLIAATGCHVGGRTLRILDFGKVAATFVDSYTEGAIRIAPNDKARTLSFAYAANARNRWEAMLLGYQVMPVEELFCVQYVHLNLSLEEIVSKLSKKAQCEICHEEIINGREVTHDGSVLCRSCAGEDYYEVLDVSRSLVSSAPHRLCCH
ncbi:MAG TPA: FmdE family protein [Anaerolineales bacterium]|nr:FmdE family protein [Anaerolineales bacterium]